MVAFLMLRGKAAGR